MLIKLDNDKCMPRRAHTLDAGMDLVSNEDECYGLNPGESRLIDTGVSIQLPDYHVGLVFNRSSQGKVKVQINNAVGVIDSEYRGNIKVLLTNNGTKFYTIDRYETRIAQLVIVPILIPKLEVWVGTDDSWEQSTARGTGGFGSTG